MKKKIARLMTGTFVATIFCMICTLSASAAESGMIEAGKPAGVDTSSVDEVVNIIFWVIRILIAAAGLIPSLPKIITGINDENPRDRNGGITGAVVTVAIFGASFGIQALF